MSHAIKIEDLDIEQSKADLMVETFTDILRDLGFSHERIESIMCRSCSGFSPFSDNKGGVEGRCYTMNSALMGSGYDYAGQIEAWHQYQTKSYKEEHPGKYRFIDQVNSGKRKESDLYQTVLDHYYEYTDGDSDYDSTQFTVRFLVRPDQSVDVDVFGSTSDAPYFRSSDYNKNENFEFKDVETFKKEVLKFLDTCECVDLIGECW